MLVVFVEVSERIRFRRQCRAITHSFNVIFFRPATIPTLAFRFPNVVTDARIDNIMRTKRCTRMLARFVLRVSFHIQSFLSLLRSLPASIGDRQRSLEKLRRGSRIRAGEYIGSPCSCTPEQICGLTETLGISARPRRYCADVRVSSPEWSAPPADCPVMAMS